MFNTYDMWLRKNINAIIAIATLITSVVTCYLSYQQTTIVDYQIEMARREKQPIFEIKKSMIDWNHDGVDDTECMMIRIIKNETKEIYSIKCSTYYKIEKTINSGKEFRIDTTIYVPINGYFGSHGEPYGHTDIVVCDTTENNYQSYTIFRGECLDKSIIDRNAGYSCDKIDFIEIKYKDVYGMDETIYFEGSRLSTKEMYQYVDELAKRCFGNNSFHFYYVKLNDVLRGGVGGN